MSHSAKSAQTKQDNLFDRERIACLKSIVTKSILKEEVDRRKLQKRLSRKCPAVVTVLFVVAMWFHGNDCYTHVFRWLHRFSPSKMPSSSALTQARARIGVGILAAVFHRVVGCLCDIQTPDSFYAGRRIVAVDGFVLNLADSDANRQAFGRPKNGSSLGAYPQVRVVALCEVGSHAFFSFLAKPFSSGEPTMAQRVYQDLPENSLLMFDINFCSYKLMKQVIDQKSDFVGRSKVNRCLPLLQKLSDGSYLSKIYANDHDRSRDCNGQTIRVIEYTLDDPQRVGHEEKHRLVTSLLDLDEHPSETLIMLYHERWEEELAIDEIKTHLRHAPKLRSHSPAGVIQEIYGLLLAHFVIRKIAVEAAALAGVSPRRISFVGTINVLRVCLVEAPRSPRMQKIWYQNLIIEISLQLVEPRRNRINPRVIKKQQSKWPKKREKHRKTPPLKLHFHDAIRILT